MRTTLNVDDEALESAMKVAPGKTKTDVINEALREFARRRRMQGFLELAGRVQWDGGSGRAPQAEPGRLKVLVDSSVWIDFFNGNISPQRNALAELFDSPHEICTCGVVVSEVFQGLRRMPDPPAAGRVVPGPHLPGASRHRPLLPRRRPLPRPAATRQDDPLDHRLPDRRARRRVRMRPAGPRPGHGDHPPERSAADLPLATRGGSFLAASRCRARVLGFRPL